ncbi:hypothetical protein NW768_004013 [Fusarium equiseti]|uniref:Uncharacterized protein n=1 Tax=Fusarium equiseti TaxID=61235 RepID=A0ABQ8RJ94_FUSEQ|nr:hypothetical protein NW768_004013 [Fusarium equiseti]
MSFLSAFRVACTNLGCFGAPTNIHDDAPNATWLLEHRCQRHGKQASTKGKTPIASLYRMYEYLVVGYTFGLRSEIEYFFNQPWSVKSIPDPEDPDPARYAILAVLTHYLVKAFNRLIERGLPRGCPAIIDPDTEARLRSQEVVLEQQPSWVKSVHRLKEPFKIPLASGETPADSTLSVEF